MNTILFLDLETTGLDVSIHHVIEVGWALWGVDCRAMLLCGSVLVDHDLDENAAEHINGIPVDALTSGYPWVYVQDKVAELQLGSDVTIAHNAAFDRKWFRGDIQAAPWLCSKTQIEWPHANPDKMSLVDVALAHGVGVVHAHRAISDVLTLVRLFERVAETVDIAELLSSARLKRRYRALVSYAERQLAKDAGFSWDGATKLWTKWLTEECTLALPFDVAEAA